MAINGVCDLEKEQMSVSEVALLSPKVIASKEQSLQLFSCSSRSSQDQQFRMTMVLSTKRIVPWPKERMIENLPSLT